MNAPFLWILVPMVAAAALLGLLAYPRAVHVAGVVVVGALAWVAWQFPIGEAVTFGPWSFKIGAAFTVLGRRFLLEEADRGTVGSIFLLAELWLLGAWVARPGHLFVPLGLMVVSFLVAALAVQPFLFAALFIELAVLISIPLLVPPGKQAGQGVLRYLTFQTLGAPFILFTGWMLSGGGANPADQEFVARAAVLIGFGFAFLLAVFPFHTWVPLLAEEVHPYVAAFLFLILPGIISIFGLGFLQEYTWLRNSPEVFGMLRAVGFLMVVTGGTWAAFERHLGRLMGYATLVEIGLSLLAIGLGSGAGLVLFFALAFPRTLGYFFWAMGLSELRRAAGSLDFRAMHGLGRQMPVTAGVVVIANLSVLGFPLLASFPVHLVLLEQLAAHYPTFGYGVLLGMMGLLGGALRSLAVLVMAVEEDAQPRREPRALQIIFGLGWGVLVAAGLFPQWIVPLLARLPLAFPQLGP